MVSPALASAEELPVASALPPHATPLLDTRSGSATGAFATLPDPALLPPPVLVEPPEFASLLAWKSVSALPRNQPSALPETCTGVAPWGLTTLPASPPCLPSVAMSPVVAACWVAEPVLLPAPARPSALPEIWTGRAQ